MATSTIIVSKRLTVWMTKSHSRALGALIIACTVSSTALAARVKSDTPIFPNLPVPPVVTCEITATSTIEKPELYGLNKEGVAAGAALGVSITYPDLVLFRAYCYADKDVKIKTTTDIIKFPACDSASNVCTYYQRAEPDNLQLSTSKILVAEYLVQNKTATTYKIVPSDLVVRIAPGTKEVEVRKFTPILVSPNETPIYPPVTDAKCRVVVSGALDPIPENVENPEVRVANGKLLFTASVTGLVGLGGQVVSTTWTGGPDASTGQWETPPLNQVSQVEANVKIKSGQTVKCGIRIKPMGRAYSIGLSRFGDCGFFGGVRSYYYLNKENKSFQNTGYNPPIQLLGLPINYGSESADIPFRGVSNGAASIEGVINVGTNGDIVIPPAAVRKYKAAVIIARSFNSATQKISPEPVAWGILDYSNYSITQMTQAKNVSEDETIVFQVYLAASQIVNGVDIRGGAAANSIAYQDFRPGTADNKAFDRIVPLVNSSCGSMTLPIPPRADKAVPAELTSPTMCAFSKPHVLKDLTQGRISLEVMHVVPENALHRFPPELVKTAANPACVAGKTSENAEANTACWNVKAAQIGINTDKEPFKEHSSCQTTTIVTTTTTVPSPGGYRGDGATTTVTTSTPKVSYTASCNVIEQNECGASTAIRFSGYNQMMLAGLGCSAQYNKPDESVTATLPFQGIIPYTTFGGSAPMDWKKYPKTFTSGGKTLNIADPKGFACIPCRFGSDAMPADVNLENSTAALPVDQDSTGAARKPIYKFSKGVAPASCVKNVSFEVRYFGSSACDGVAAPPGHFCSSGNITPQSCGSSETGGPARVGGGGNVAGSFRIPVCPGSGIESDSVSVSWSPIIVDVTGNGISISRQFTQAKVFDIRGDGRERLIDWPYNNDEVAFLVRPNKGKVTSIKELFGDYKAKNGFEALRKLDDNKDGFVSKKDKSFKELALWFDRNRNGKLDPGELETLEAHGVAELPLQYVKPNRKGVEGRTLSTVYFNHKQQRYMNIEDHYFYEYITNGRKMSQK